MAKFTITCPHCGAANQASTWIFKRKFKCGACHKEIKVARDRVTSRKCPHCNNEFVYDQAKTIKNCPVCRAKLAEAVVKVECPQCDCELQVSYAATGEYTCPVCDHKIEHIDRVIAKSELVDDFRLNVIKYEGDNDTFVWKHPIEDFTLGSQLIVHETQEVYFLQRGETEKVFGPGRHTLKTENLPVLRIFQDVIHAEVYFINKTVQMSIPWELPHRVRFVDPETGAPISIGVSGEMNLQVIDGATLLKKIVGTTNGISWERPDGTRDKHAFTHSLRSYFNPMIATVVRSNLARIIKEDAIDILEIDEHLDTLSSRLQNKVAAGFEEYGLTVARFYITSVQLPEDDENFQLIRKFRTESMALREIEMDKNVTLAKQQADIALGRAGLAMDEITAQRQVIEKRADIDIDAESIRAKGMATVNVEEARGMAEAKVMEAKHYDQKDVIGADVQKAYAEALGDIGKNGGANGVVGDLVGLGIGVAALGAVTDKAAPAMANLTAVSAQTDVPAAQLASSAGGWDCACGQKGITSKFCPNCGAQKPVAWDCPCGQKGNTSKFCPNCGAAKPETWDCSCGKKGNNANFCPVCGNTKA